MHGEPRHPASGVAMRNAARSQRRRLARTLLYSRHMTTIPSDQLEHVSGGLLLPVWQPQRDTNGAIIDRKLVGNRENNYACGGAICGGERVKLHFLSF